VAEFEYKRQVKYKACPVCGTKFFANGQWVWRAKGKSKNVKKGDVVCSYHCMRVTEQYAKTKLGRPKKKEESNDNCQYVAG